MPGKKPSDMKPHDVLDIRVRLDLTQAQLAEQLGLSRDAIARMEGGRADVQRVTQLALEHLLCRKKKRRGGL